MRVPANEPASRIVEGKKIFFQLCNIGLLWLLILLYFYLELPLVKCIVLAFAGLMQAGKSKFYLRKWLP
jgi:hypothetical protein